MANPFKRIRKRIKRIGRKIAPIKAKVLPYAVGGASAVVSYLAPWGLGQAAAAGITAAGAVGGRYFGATAARAKGYSGREARHKGRTTRERVITAGLVGTAGGSAVKLLLPLVSGSTAAAVAPAAAPSAFQTWDSLNSPKTAAQPVEGAIPWETLLGAVPKVMGEEGGGGGGSGGDDSPFRIPSFADARAPGGDSPEWLMPALLVGGALILFA